MGNKYNAHSPGHYPISWLTAANQALAAPGEWFSVDWARGEAGAVSRMKRLRAFRDGILKYPSRAQGLADAFAAGKVLRFRKIERFGVWDVQVSLQEASKMDFETDK